MPKMPKSNDPCWCGSGEKLKRCHKAPGKTVSPGQLSPLRTVPDSIDKPSWADGGDLVRWNESNVKSPEIIEAMKLTAVEAADTLDALGKLCTPGTTTDEIDEACHNMAIEKNAYPSPLLYPGHSTPFPKSVCTSVNEVICHGIPDDRPLQDGDIINIDVTLFKRGVHGDTNATFYVGEVDDRSKHLTEVTRDSLALGIDAAKPGAPINAIGAAIQEYAEANNLGVVKDFVGHGIGEQFHTDLQICHYYHPKLTTEIKPGMTFTIEPMLTMGDWDAKMWNDGWTASTRDQSRTAQFEHTLLITETGAEILTTPTDTSQHPFWALPSSL